MNYHSMTLPELAKELRSRQLGNVHLYNELNKIYGVTMLPPRQEAARQEAIERLREHDKNKPSFRKVAAIIGGFIAFLAAIATIIELFIN